jgi:hypothetical protein
MAAGLVACAGLGGYAAGMVVLGRLGKLDCISAALLAITIARMLAVCLGLA